MHILPPDWLAPTQIDSSSPCICFTPRQVDPPCRMKSRLTPTQKQSKNLHLHEMEWSTTKRGRPAALYKGYSYVFHKELKTLEGVSVWRCPKRNAHSCNACIYISGDDVFRDPQPAHTHTENWGEIGVKIIVEKAKKAPCKDPYEDPQAIWDWVLQDVVTGEVAGQMPVAHPAKKMIQNAQRGERGHGKEPQNLKDIEHIHDSYMFASRINAGCWKTQERRTQSGS